MQMKKPTILEINEKKLVGSKIMNSLANDKTGALWQSFMPKRKQIKNRQSNEYFSIQIFDGGLVPENFSEDTIFEKWAAVEVSEYEDIPEGMKTLDLPSGKYAVFIHHGLSSEFDRTLKHIYEDWLPESGYQIDARPHFEIMGDKYYGPTDANSEEEVWIPIK